MATTSSTPESPADIWQRRLTSALEGANSSQRADRTYFLFQELLAAYTSACDELGNVRRVSERQADRIKELDDTVEGLLSAVSNIWEETP